MPAIKRSQPTVFKLVTPGEIEYETRQRARATRGYFKVHQVMVGDPKTTGKSENVWFGSSVAYLKADGLQIATLKST